MSFLWKHLFAVLLLGTLGISMQASTLMLGAGTVSRGSSISLPVSIGDQSAPVSGIEWTFTFSPADVSKIEVSVGTSAAQAGKQVDCAAAGSGRYKCLLIGSNTQPIADGVAAVATVTIATTASPASAFVGLVEPAATTPAADAEATSGTGATLTIPSSATLNSLSCVASSLNEGSSTACVARLSGVAPAGGAIVSLGSTSVQGVSASLPSSITIPQSQNEASFDVRLESATSSSSVLTLTASLYGTSRTASISVVTPVSISVSPSAVSLAAGQTRQFAATVQGLSNSAVFWQVSSGVGTISNSGVYTSPATVASTQTVIIKATSVGDPTKVAVALVTLNPSTTLPDRTAPAISSVAAAPSQTSAEIVFTTNESALGQIVYGTSTWLLAKSQNASTAAGTAHRIVIVGLTPGVRYYFRVIATDAAQNKTTWPNNSTAALSFQTVTTALRTLTPTRIGIGTGSLRYGTLVDLSANDAHTVQIAANEKLLEWGVGIAGIPTGVTKAAIRYSATYSQSCSEQVAAWNWSSNQWQTIVSYASNPAKTTRSIAVPSPLASYIQAGSQELLLKINCSTTTGTFFANVDELVLATQ